MDQIIIISIIIISIFLLFSFYIAFFYFKKKQKKLDKDKLKSFEKILKKINLNSSNKEKIIDYDKIYHKILLELWYVWNFWDILKLNPKEISDINKIWELHKLRNKLAHDFDLLEEKILLSKQKEYLYEIEKLLNKIS